MDAKIKEVISDLNLQFNLKQEQELAITHICQGLHVFCALPTGYGKSIIYALPPLIMDKVPTYFRLSAKNQGRI